MLQTERVCQDRLMQLNEAARIYPHAQPEVPVPDPGSSSLPKKQQVILAGNNIKFAPARTHIAIDNLITAPF